MHIRPAVADDRDEWARMRHALWPDSYAENLAEIDQYLEGGHAGMCAVLVLEKDSDRLCGFIEIRVRDYAEGCRSEKVPYVEGWYVDTDVRQMGYGRQLIKAAETWATERGYTELASDAEIENLGSIAAHKSLGFDEVDRIVCFIKKI